MRRKWEGTKERLNKSVDIRNLTRLLAPEDIYDIFHFFDSMLRTGPDTEQAVKVCQIDGFQTSSQIGQRRLDSFGNEKNI